LIESRRHAGLLIAPLDHPGFGRVGGASWRGHRCQVNEALTEDEQSPCTAGSGLASRPHSAHRVTVASRLCGAQTTGLGTDPRLAQQSPGLPPASVGCSSGSV
jgi:hypothetical protein